MNSNHRDSNMTTKILVRDIMNSPVIYAYPDTNIQEIANKMSAGNVGSVVITDNDIPIGIVTDWDIVSRGVIKDLKPSSIKSSEVMKNLYTIEGEETITEAARKLRKYDIKRLGVTYKSKLVGIISSTDVLSVTPELIDVVSEKSSLIRGEIGRPMRHLSGYCDECNEWSDLLTYSDGIFTCEDCRTDSIPNQ